MRRTVALVALVALLLPAAAVSAEESAPTRARYLLATGLPDPAPAHFGLVCSDAVGGSVGGGTLHVPQAGVEQPLPLVTVEKVWVGGACLSIGAGERTVSATDDTGAAASFWWHLWSTDDAGDRTICDLGRADGPLVLDVPEGCDVIDVTPIAGSASGVIEIA